MTKHHISTPIYPMKFSDGKNFFYIKREDLLPFSFGGNKVRIAEKYFIDMEKKNKNCIIAYGNTRSNLCRVIANMARSKNIPCYVITPTDNSGGHIVTNNSKLVESQEVHLINCLKDDVSGTVLKVMKECKSQGLRPYYIYGDIYGKGNEEVAVQAYVEVYDEIRQFEQESAFNFDYIFLASGTGTTQAGLICGQLLHGDNRKIVGISIARNKCRGGEIVLNNVQKYLNEKRSDVEEKICFDDQYLLGGYSKYNDKVINTIKEILDSDGVPLDTTYTGKAFFGMTKYLKENSITKAKILFIHTGGIPLFFDNIHLL